MAAFGGHFLINLTLLALICMILLAFISCVEAALNDGGDVRGLLFLFLNSFLGIVGVRGQGSDGSDSVDRGGSDRDGYC